MDIPDPYLRPTHLANMVEPNEFTERTICMQSKDPCCLDLIQDQYILLHSLIMHGSAMQCSAPVAVYTI